MGLGSRAPTTRGRPIWPGRRGGAGWYRDASGSLVTTPLPAQYAFTHFVNEMADCYQQQGLPSSLARLYAF